MTEHAVSRPDLHFLQNASRPDPQKRDVNILEIAVAHLDGKGGGREGEEQIPLPDFHAFLGMAERTPALGDQIDHVGGFGDELVALRDDGFIHEIDGVDLIAAAPRRHEFTDIVVLSRPHSFSSDRRVGGRRKDKNQTGCPC